MLYPLTFKPIIKERLWGGRSLERLYGKSLPADLPIGESWEISDRPGDVSVVDRGSLAGQDLHTLLGHSRQALLGSAALAQGRFPLLVKILDARQTLSLQVHPPAGIAAEWNGEPKTEMWYLADAQPGAELFAGLKRGVTREEFEEKLHSGGVATCFHRLPVRAGDAMFVPSGRVHAVGAGCVIFEIQQNSDTTYRVFDWNRVGSDGRSRALHIPESLRSIDFDDFEPSLIDSQFEGNPESQVRRLVNNELFAVEEWRLAEAFRLEFKHRGALIVGVVSGRLQLAQERQPVELGPGQFCLLPASLGSVVLQALTPVRFLVVQPK